MAQSETHIANRALQAVGATSPITDLAAATPNARTIRTAYRPILRALLMRYVWKFSIRRQVLSKVAAFDQLVPGYNVFHLPQDYIRMPYTQRPGESRGEPDWVVEGGNLLSVSDTSVTLRYCAFVEDVTRFNPLFDEVLALYIAKEVVEEMRSATRKKQVIQRDYLEAFDAARKAGAMENPPIKSPDDPWLASFY